MTPTILDAQPPAPKHGHIDRISTQVLDKMVEMVVVGAIPVGGAFPSERALCDDFGVSRTVIRECMKRLQEKGLVLVVPARGTHVRDPADWNVLDSDVFDALIRHDESLGVLDEVSAMRVSFEGMMAQEVAHAPSAELLVDLEAHLDEMRRTQDDRPAFLEADLRFHLAMMAASRNRVASNIAHRLFLRPRSSARWDGLNPPDAIELTIREHERILAAMYAHDGAAARAATEDHIAAAWRRRRYPDGDRHVTA